VTISGDWVLIRFQRKFLTRPRLANSSLRSLTSQRAVGSDIEQRFSVQPLSMSIFMSRCRSPIRCSPTSLISRIRSRPNNLVSNARLSCVANTAHPKHLTVTADRTDHANAVA
jgi:hypothetical protein